MDSQGEWVGLAQASQALKLSITTIRRQIKRGEVEARQVNTQHGPVWQVRITTDDQEGVEEDNLDNHLSQAKVNQDGELPILFRELQDRMVEKAEAAAMWQARAEMLSFQLQGAQETIRMLEAPKSQATEAVVVPESPQEALETADSGEAVSESREERHEPWWRRFWQLVSV